MLVVVPVPRPTTEVSCISVFLLPVNSSPSYRMCVARALCRAVTQHNAHMFFSETKANRLVAAEVHRGRDLDLLIIGTEPKLTVDHPQI